MCDARLDPGQHAAQLLLAGGGRDGLALPKIQYSLFRA